MNSSDLLAFLRADRTRFQWRTLRAIGNHFPGATLAAVSDAVAQAPGAFLLKAGKNGLYLAAA